MHESRVLWREGRVKAAWGQNNGVHGSGWGSMSGSKEQERRRQGDCSLNAASTSDRGTWGTVLTSLRLSLYMGEIK